MCCRNCTLNTLFSHSEVGGSINQNSTLSYTLFLSSERTHFPQLVSLASLRLHGKTTSPVCCVSSFSLIVIKKQAESLLSPKYLWIFLPSRTFHTLHQHQRYFHFCFLTQASSIAVSWLMLTICPMVLKILTVFQLHLVKIHWIHCYLCLSVGQPLMGKKEEKFFFHSPKFTTTGASCKVYLFFT